MKELTKASRKGPLLAIIGVNFIWGFDFIAIEYLMDYMPEIGRAHV